MKESVEAFALQDYFPFIIKTVSEVTGRYVEVENSIELSIALERFARIQLKYEPSRGPFLPYLKTAIRNALIDYMKSEHVRQTYPLDPDMQMVSKDSNVLDAAMIHEYERSLRKYKISFLELSKKTPVHHQTRNRLLKLGKQLATDPSVVAHLVQKKRLPITVIVDNYDTTVKIVKSHKIYLISIIIAYVEAIDPVMVWLDGQVERG